MPNLSVARSLSYGGIAFPSNDGGINATKDFSVTGAITGTASVADGQTNKELAISFDKDQVAVLGIVSSQDVLIESNDGSSPADSLSLSAGEPYIWTSDSPDAFAFASADVTKILVTNASGSTAQIEWLIGLDTTP